MKVKVYKNLHKNCYSVKASEGQFKNKVIFHASSLTLSDVSFKVYENGRKRTIKEKQKNVHAFIEGYLESMIVLKGRSIYPSTIDYTKGDRLSYNPYRFPYFYVCHSLEPIYNCETILLDSEGIWKIK